ncbi:MAG: DUF5041 domain-containing protein [Bacteroidaceae bacterium]|nr:DUF5041 domain-containing protein [Bacteroidaceae bacterium]
MRKKNILWTALMMAVVSLMPCKAQQVTTTPLSIDDVAFALEVLGVQTTRFDLTQFKDKKYNVSVYVDEYEKGNPKAVNRKQNRWGTNLIDLRQYPEEERERRRQLFAIPEGEHIGLRITDAVFALHHAKGDSIATFKYHVNMAGGTSLPLKLRKLEGLRLGYSYYLRPFALKPIQDKDEVEIPLWLYGSAWPDGNFFRFCGENEIDPEMKADSDILTYCPHYFVIGISLKKVAK